MFKKTGIKRCRKTLLYGEPGVGKTTFAADFESPVFICTEDGTPPGVVATDLLTSSGEIAKAIKEAKEGIVSGELECKAMVIDSISEVQNILAREISAQMGISSIGEADFGKGYSKLTGRVQRLLQALDDFITATGCEVLLIAHRAVEPIELPDGTSYTRFSPELYSSKKGTGPALDVIHWCDEVLFATTDISIKTVKDGAQKRNVASGGKERLLHIGAAPHYVAKTRLPMPDSMLLDAKQYLKAREEAFQRLEKGATDHEA